MAGKSRTHNALLNSAAGMAARLFNIITGFIMHSIFIAILGIEYAGISSLFTDLLTLLSFAELGISSAIAFSLYKPIAEGDHVKISKLMLFFKRAYRVVACVVVVLGAAMIPFMDILIPADKIDPAIRQEVTGHIILIFSLYVTNSAVSYLNIYKSTLLTAHQENRRISSIQMVMSLVRVAVETTVLLTLNLVIKENRIWIFIIYLVAGIVITWTTNLIISVCADRRYPYVDYNTKEKLSKEEKSRLYKDVGALMINKICQEINTSLDSIVISAFFGPLWVGLTYNYRLVTGRTRMIILQFFNAVNPSLGNLAAEADSERQYKTFLTLRFVSFWICCFCSTSFIVLLDPFIELWLGSEYIMNIWIPILLTAIFYNHTIIGPVTTVRSANGLFVQGKYRPVFLCASNVIISIALAHFMGQGGSNPEAGVIGIKLATVLSFLLTTNWYDPMLIYKKIFKKPLAPYFVSFVKEVAVTAVCAAATFGVGWLLFGHAGDGGYAGLFPGTPRLLAFAAKAVLCLIIPNGAMILLYRNTEEFQKAFSIAKGFAGKLIGRKNKAAVSNNDQQTGAE